MNAAPQSRNTPDHNAAALGETLCIIRFGFHFKYKYQFKDIWLDFLPLNELVCLDKILTTSMEHILNYEEMHAFKQPPLEPFTLMNLTFISTSSNPTLLKVGKNDILGETESGGRTDSLSSNIKVCERRDIKVRGARYEASAVILTLKIGDLFSNQTSDDSTLTCCCTPTKAFLSQPLWSSSQHRISLKATN